MANPGDARGGPGLCRARTDKDQLQRWQQEIELLQAKIRDARITVDVGTELAAAPSTNAAPVNANCPVSGKSIDPTKTVLHEGGWWLSAATTAKQSSRKIPNRSWPS